MLCHKPPLVPVDGSTKLTWGMITGLLDAGVDLDVLAVETDRHQNRSTTDGRLEELTRFSSVYVDTRVTPWRALRGLVQDSYNVRRFWSEAFRTELVDRLTAGEFDAVIVDSLFMTPYIETVRAQTDALVMLRAHNVEHEIWGSLADQVSGPRSWYFRHLARRLRHYEIRSFGHVDAIATVSARDRDAIMAVAPETPVGVIEMGLPTPAIDPDPARGPLCSIASYDWLPNLDGTRWFLDEVWPGIRAAIPDAELEIGGRDSERYRREFERPGVTVVGDVDSVERFLIDRGIVVAPVRSGSGVRVKVIESMLIGKPVVTTSVGAQGITDGADGAVRIADTAAEFSSAIVELMAEPESARQLGGRAREEAEGRFSSGPMVASTLALLDRPVASTSTGQRESDASARATEPGSRDSQDGSLLSRSAWTLSDQALSSLFSLVIGFAAAQALSAEQFGLFAALFTSYLVARGIVRSLGLDPLTMLFAGRVDAIQRGRAFGLTLGTAIATAGLVLVAAVFVDSLSFAAAIAGGIMITLLLVIDSSRIIDIAAGRPARATFISAVLLIAGLAALVVASTTTMAMPSLLGLFAIAALLALLARRPPVGRRASPSQTATWVRAHRTLARPLLVDFVATAGSAYLALYLLAFLDFTEAGVLRAAQIVAAPLHMLFVGAIQVIMTEGSRPDALRSDLAQVVARRALLLAVGVSLMYLGLVVVSGDLLSAALGDTGPEAEDTIKAMVVLAALTAPNAVATGLLRAWRRPDLVARARVISLVPALLSAVIGGLTYGAMGVVVLGIVAQLLTLPIWWLAVVQGRRSRDRHRPVARS